MWRRSNKGKQLVNQRAINEKSPAAFEGDRALNTREWRVGRDLEFEIDSASHDQTHSSNLLLASVLGPPFRFDFEDVRYTWE